MSEESMIEAAQHATGDIGIVVAGLFLPRGFIGHTLAPRAGVH